MLGKIKKSSIFVLLTIAVVTNKDIRGNTINRLDLAATISGQFNFMEIWKDIPQYEGLYQVSSLGNVKSLIKHNGLKERILKPGVDGCGYLFVVITKDKKAKTCTIHKLVAIAFLGHKPDGTQKIVVDHINNIKYDNRIENLQLISQRLNSSKDAKGTSKYTGVSWYKPLNKWVASIKINGKTKKLGYFENEYDAAKAYQNKLNKL